QPSKGLARVARAAMFLLCHALSGAIYLGGQGPHPQKPKRETVVAMIRVVIENILLFLTPMAVYIAYMLLTRRAASAGTVVSDAPLIWLFVAGALLVVATLVFYGSPPGGPPRPGQLSPPHGQEGGEG